jgi:hypothetical protein
MSLTGLPVELVSRVYRFLGRKPSKCGKRFIYENKDFLSLRSTCKDLYAKTTYDASVRYRLHELELSLTASSLALFLHLSSIPAFRHRMETIYLYSDIPPVGTESIAMIAEPEEQLTWFLQSEDEYSFVRSGEAVHMLAQCLRNLRNTISLGEMTYCSGTYDVIGQTAVLRAREVPNSHASWP